MRAQWNPGCPSAGNDNRRSRILIQTGLWMRHRLAHWDPCEIFMIWSRLWKVQGSTQQGGVQWFNLSSWEKERALGQEAGRKLGKKPKDLRKWRKWCRNYFGHSIIVCLTSQHVNLNYLHFPCRCYPSAWSYYHQNPFLSSFLRMLCQTKHILNQITIVFLSLFLLPCPLAIKKGSWFVKVCLSLSHVDHYIGSVTIV